MGLCLARCGRGEAGQAGQRAGQARHAGSPAAGLGRTTKTRAGYLYTTARELLQDASLHPSSAAAPTSNIARPCGHTKAVRGAWFGICYPQGPAPTLSYFQIGSVTHHRSDPTKPLIRSEKRPGSDLKFAGLRSDPCPSRIRPARRLGSDLRPPRIRFLLFLGRA